MVIVPALVIGWFLCRGRITAIAEQRATITGQYPVVANRPGIDGRAAAGDDTAE